MKVLILCTGNSCRSQMAHGFLQSFDVNLHVRSGGTEPAARINRKAVEVMADLGIDISHHTPHLVDEYIEEEWDYVITVCDHANETCPAFFGKVKHRLHLGFEDPSHATGTPEFIHSEYIRIRDQIRETFLDFYMNNLKQNNTAQELKLIVQEKYGKIATSADADGGSCCGTSSCCSYEGLSTFNDSYSHLEGYVPDADLSLGCGVPVDYAAIRPGDSVLDLGSGAGNDCFVARAITGETGQVTGLDFTENMLLKSEENRKRMGYENVQFIRGDIEEMPLPDNSFDVVLSNCVLNLVPDKQKAFSEIMRVLKPGGHFCVSDVVLKGALSEKARSDAELYVGCVSGASTIEEYLGFIHQNGFTDITIHKEKRIEMPEGVITQHDGIEESGVYSITISGFKPHAAS